MCELEWYALAEIQLRQQDKQQDIYCLCSRVFVRTKDDSLKQNAFIELSASQEDLSIEEDLSSECNSLPTICKNRIKPELEQETVSCYCSASHTDNLSTDEHDSLRDTTLENRTQFRTLQSSDSGTDLTEYIKQDIDIEWQKFWSINGEKLIWKSWIGKYSAYINPEYLQYAQDHINDREIADENNIALKLELEPINNEANNKLISDDTRNRILLRSLSGSDDKLNTEVSEGWNPLSPSSIIDCETEIEQLLSSKCSYTSSSIRTVDSMTNVTRMTISSIDLSNNSHSSDSFSSVSSVQSSLSSTTTTDDTDEHEHQWNILWTRHYEEQYLNQYKIFVKFWKEQNIPDSKICDKIDNALLQQTNDTLLTSPSNSKLSKKNIHKVFQGRVDGNVVKDPIQVNSQVVDSLSDILKKMKMSSEENTEINKDIQVDSDGDEESIDQDEFGQMSAMGLPTKFGGKSTKRQLSDEMETSLSHDFESCRKRVKAAFNLIGIEFNDNTNPMSGNVHYKMKHIRLQNRHLILRNPQQRQQQSKHIYFDDDGNIITPNETSPEDIEFQSILPNDDKLSSGDEEIVSNDLVTTPSKIEEQSSQQQQQQQQTDENIVSKRKKRKKKLIVPPEIKENSHLYKYWRKRFLLFNKFDEGIKLDEESWYSVTPEYLAKHIAERCKCDVIIDGFCGAGGNAIQFAFTCRKVIAIDIDPKKIELARNNANVYGVADKIEFIVGDFFKLADCLKADVVFFSPPWGGPSYLKQTVYDLETMLLPVPMSKLLEAGRKITSNIAVFLPRNSNSFLLIDESKPGGGVEIEQNFMKKSLVSITAYYNELIKKIK